MFTRGTRFWHTAILQPGAIIGVGEKWITKTLLMIEELCNIYILYLMNSIWWIYQSDTRLRTGACSCFFCSVDGGSLGDDWPKKFFGDQLFCQAKDATHWTMIILRLLIYLWMLRIQWIVTVVRKLLHSKVNQQEHRAFPNKDEVHASSLPNSIGGSGQKILV